MSRQIELLPKPPRQPRQPRRVVAHMIDAGAFPDGRKAVLFECNRCAWSQWMPVKTNTEARRGYPCPNCNT